MPTLKIQLQRQYLKQVFLTFLRLILILILNILNVKNFNVETKKSKRRSDI